MTEVSKAFDQIRKALNDHPAKDEDEQGFKVAGLAVCTVIESIAVSLERIADAADRAAGPANGFNSDARRARVQETLRTRPYHDPDVPF